MEDETIPLRATILVQQEKLYDIKMECFDKVKKMADKVKMIKKHLDIVSQTHQIWETCKKRLYNLMNQGALKSIFPVVSLQWKAMTS